MAEVSRIWTINGKRPLAPADLAAQAVEYDLPMEWHGLANGISIPRGRRYGTAHFLIPASDLAALQNGPIDIVCTHEGGRTTWHGWYLDAFQSVTKQSTPAYWVRLCDPRFLLEKSSSEAIRFNFRNATDPEPNGYVADSTFGGSGTPYTWQQVLAALWAFLPAGVAGSCPTLPYTPTTTPENLCFDGIGTWRAICQVLTAIGCSVTWDPFDSQFRFINLRSAQTGLATELSRLDRAGLLLWSDNAGSGGYDLPQTLGALFEELPQAANDYQPFHLQPYYQEGTIGGATGKFELLDTTYHYSGRSLTARVNEIAESLRYLLDARANPYAATFGGVVELLPGERLSSVRWVSDGDRGFQTMLFYQREELDWPKPPFFGNISDAQSYAVVFQLAGGLARGVGATASATVIASSDTGHTALGATITVYNTGQMLGLTGAYGVAILFGEQWWIVDLDQQCLLAVFDFTSATHTSGTFAIANQTAWTLSNFLSLTPYPFNDVPATQLVMNPYNLIAFTGDKGLCAYNINDGKYLLIKVYPANARRFMFELTANWPNGLDQTSTNSALIYPDPTHQGGECNLSGFTLRDRYNLAHNAKTGDIGICQLDYETGQYIIHHITHVFTRGRGNVYAGFSDGRATFTCDNLVGFDGRNPTSPLTVHNELEIDALATGDKVELRWNPIAGRYYALGSGGGGGGAIDYFVLAEDASPLTGRAYMYAYRGDISLTTSDINVEIIDDASTMFKLYHWDRILKVTKYAKAGYSGICSHDVKGRMVFVNGGCVDGCQADGTITLDLPDGQVGSAYSHTMTGTTIDTSTIAVTGLPDGLTYNSGTREISGTPTESGLFVLIITATSNNACEITNAFELTIDPEP